MDFGVYDQVYQTIYLTAIFFDDFSFVKNLDNKALYPTSLNYFGLSEDERKQWDIDVLRRLKELKLNEYVSKKLTVSDFEKININQKYLNL